MKTFLLTVLLAFCIFQNASADWKNNVKINHWQQINSIINSALGRIQNEANSKNSAAARQCLESARLQLRSITQSGYSAVSNCVYSASTEGIANVCAQKVDSQVFNEALEVGKTASKCIEAA